MRNHIYVSSVLCILILTLAAPTRADDPRNSQSLVLSKIGLMYVGGRRIPMQGGGRFAGGTQTQIVEQALVHYLIPPKDRQEEKLPVIMVPGMGLTSYLYLATPDGRDGWAQIFARAGHPVYIFDEPLNAISGFDVSGFNTVRQNGAKGGEAPGFMLWANETVWRRWGIGTEPGVPFKDTRYPVEHITQLYASMTPVYQTGPGRSTEQGRPTGAPAQSGRGTRFRRRASALGDQAPATRRRGRGGGGGGRFGAGVKASALAALLDKIGPAMLIVHSASGGTGFAATRIRPDLVKAIVAVEVVGSPTDADDVKENFANKHFIGIFGDHFDIRRMAGRHRACETTAKLITEAGGRAEVIWLPKIGIKGNTHLLMQDNNNEQIARMLMNKLDD